MHEEDGKGFDGRLLRRIVRYLEPYKGWVLLAFLLTMGAAYLGPLRPRLVQEAIDNYIVPGDLEGLRIVILLLFGALAGEGMLSLVQGYLTQWIGQQAIYDLRTKVFRHVQRQSLRFFDRTPVGRLITRTTSDVEALSDVLSAGLVVILGNLFRIAFILYFMFSLNWMLALVVLAVMPAMVYGVFLFRSKVRVQYRETRKQVARLNSFLQEHVSGMNVVQVFNREREELKRFSAINDDHRAAQIKTIFYFALFWPMVDIVGSTALGLVIWFGGLQAMAGTLTVGVLIAFIQFSRQFFEPIRNLSDQYNTLQNAMAGAERIFRLLDEDRAIVEPSAPVLLERVRGHVEFRNVWFSYRQEDSEGQEPDWILRDVSFTIEPGQQVAIVGPTGTGKTTVINALLRFYDVQRGGIFIDGTDIRRLRLADLRRHVGLVPQDVFLFSGSVGRNITMNDPRISEEEMRRAAELVGVDRFIDLLPAGYDQDVRERGASLSYGQRQLLAFVRALVYDPEVLVLDEATSSVDTETEHLIEQALERLMAGRTSLVVAHRLSTIQHSDRILVMHRGHVREQGTHQELLALGGLYRKLYELQYAEQEESSAV